MSTVTREETMEADLEEEGYDEMEEDDDDEEEMKDLPPELVKLLGDCVFHSEEELFVALEEFGLDKLRVALVEGRPRLVERSHQHIAFIRHCHIDFSRWCRSSLWGKWGVSWAMTNVYCTGGRIREPDLSFWGYPRCSHDSFVGVLSPTDTGSIPDVIIQFYWKHRERYEVEVMNDLMNHGLERYRGALSKTRPRVGYLIQVLFSKKRALVGAIKGTKTQDIVGLRIYRLRHGTTIADARDANNPNAEVWDYAPGDPERFIVIAPQDLGITGNMARLCGEYKIKASEVFTKMNKYHVQLQNQYQVYLQSRGVAF